MPRFLGHLTFVLSLALMVSAARPPATFAGVESAWSSASTSAISAQVGWVSQASVARPGPVVPQAFNLLMERFVTPPNSADLLGGGWDGAVAALREKGAQDLPEERPMLFNLPHMDIRLFSEAYPRLAVAAEGRLERAGLDRAIVDGMAKSLNEGHTSYLNPEEFQRAQAQLRNDERYAGIGARFDRELVVVEVFERSPAEAGGLRPGDKLVAVDGESVEGQTSAEASSKVRGTPGTPVELMIRRGESPEPVRLALTRAEIKIDWLASRVLDDGVGYLQLRTFPTPGALGEFREAMDRFKAAGIRALVIDVRRNGGGSVDTGIEIASQFIRQGPLFQRVDRRGGERTVTTFGDYWERDVPIAVLVDNNSGSMSEILASALQENGVARVFGTRTSGNVAASNVHPLADGSGLSVTVWIIKSGQGKPLNNVGLEPDETVELDAKMLREGRDNQLDAALTYVRREAATRVSPPSS